MKIRVQSIHFDADKIATIHCEKVDKLVHFTIMIGGEVTLKVDKASDNKIKCSDSNSVGNDISQRAMSYFRRND